MTAITTKAERWWIKTVVAMGCVVCRNLEYGVSPAEFHHLRTGQGASQRAGNSIGIPLCPEHHRQGAVGVAYHAGPKTWESLYGTELELLNQTILEVAEGARRGT